MDRRDREAVLVGQGAHPAGSWLAGSFVTMTSTPVYPVSATMRNVLASGLAKKAADEKSSRGALTPPW